MFSIIIPLYNKEAFVLKTVNSVLGQSFDEFEVIIVDDGSTDNSLSVIQNIQDKRIRIISQINSGVSKARNNGVEHAKYDYVAFLDADDWWHPDFLKEMRQLIIEYNDATLYASNYYLVKNSVTKKSTVGVSEGFTSGYLNYFSVYANSFCVPVNCSFVIVKKQELVKLGGFNIGLKFGEDFDLWVRLALNAKMAYLNKYLAYSNQDVPASNRALGGNKLWKQEEHYIFNVDYLLEYESVNGELKFLLDGLRLRSLVRYYRKKKYLSQIKLMLKNIDFEDHPFVYTFIYKYPRLITEVYFLGKRYGSLLKQSLK